MRRSGASSSPSRVPARTSPDWPCRAEKDGDEWILNGQKVWTTLAHESAFGLILARTNPDVPKHRGITAFLVDMRAPGVEVRPLFQATGEAEFNECFFVDARVPDSQRLGGVGEGWGVSITTLMNERVSIGGTVPPRGSGLIGEAVKIWKKHWTGRDGRARDGRAQRTDAVLGAQRSRASDELARQ